MAKWKLCDECGEEMVGVKGAQVPVRDICADCEEKEADE
jgi:formylmethanofuran dehydrogenase subunit E